MVPADDAPGTAGDFDGRLLSAALESAPDGIVALGADGRILLHNRRFLELWGLPPTALTGRRWKDLAPELGSRLTDPADTDRLSRPRQDADGILHDLELRDDRVFRWQDAPLADPTGGTLGRIWYFRDVTVRHRVEAALKESEAHLRAIHDTAVDGIITADVQGMILSANPAALHLFGYAAGEMIGNNVARLMPEDDAREHAAHLAEHVGRSGSSTVIGRGRILRGRRRDGTLFPLDITIAEMTIGGERLFTGMLRDMSQTLAADAAIRLGVERFRDYARATSDWFWETDRDLRFRFFSDRFRELTGEEPARLLGKTRMEVGSATPSDASWQAHLNDLLHHRSFTNFTYVYRRGDSQLRVFRISGTPIVDSHGIFAGYRGVGTDITDQVAIERALETSRRRCRDLVDGSPQGILVHRNFKPLSVNAAYARILGFESAEEVLAQPSILQTVAPEFHDKARENYGRLMAGEPPPPVIRVRNIRRNGVEVWLDLAERVVDWEGVPAVQTTAVDVTEPVRLSRDLARRTAELDTLIRNLAAARGAV
ncbi:MAG TPA: PAS domain S-box protein [Azospirillaceae bacterium]|nr:PAS domain S-box protein [Azospirillaceae bacterium]